MAMTVGELIDELQANFAPDTPVFIDGAACMVEDGAEPPSALDYPQALDASLDDGDVFPDGRSPGRFCLLVPENIM